MTTVRYCQHPEGCRHVATKGWYCDEHWKAGKAKRAAANPAKGESFQLGKHGLARTPRRRG
jgi:hypothetical protein